MTASKTIHYLGYFMHRGFGSSSTRHLLLEDKGNGRFGILSKMDQFTTGAMTNVLPVLDEIWSFNRAEGLVDFCEEYRFDPVELSEALPASHRGLAEDFQRIVKNDPRFDHTYRAEHERVPADTDLIHTLIKESGLAELFVAPLMEPHKNKTPGKLVSFPEQKPEDES